MKQAAQQIVFFGGSFDPPHCGHIAIAQAAQRAISSHPEREPATVLFAPVGRQPLKPAGHSTTYDDRVAMTRLAIAGYRNFAVSLADAPNPDKSRPNYTVETLISLRSQFAPNAVWHLLLGADSFRTLHHWHRAGELPFLASLIVASRPGEDVSEVASRLPESLSMEFDGPYHYTIRNPQNYTSSLLILPDLHYDVSATQLREQINDPSADTRRFLSQAVLGYIRAHRLYEAL